jgi:hypothetical protein
MRDNVKSGVLATPEDIGSSDQMNGTGFGVVKELPKVVFSNPAGCVVRD